MTTLEMETQRAKATLLQTTGEGGANVFEHLTELVCKILEEKPTNAVDVLESMSTHIKASRLHSSDDTLKDVSDVPQDVQLAFEQAKLFRQEAEDEPDEGSRVVANMMESMRWFEDAGVGLGMEECFKIYLSLMQLAAQYPLKSVRFWGKMLGLDSNYIIAECQYREGEEPASEMPEASMSPEPAEADDETDARNRIPQSQYKPPLPVPVEENGKGANKYSYFVCSEPGMEWKALPPVTPAQISCARAIKKYLTGRLDALVVSYPPFPGTEANLLRAQIARISAATKVSPIGFYTFDEEAEDEEGRENIVVNDEFEAKSRADLLDPNLSCWVHHGLYILNQGRCRWESTKRQAADQDDEEGEDDMQDEEPEVGPPLLTPLQNDEEFDGQPAWSVKLSSAVALSHACVRVSSNVWPGAHAFAVGNKFENVYIGTGIKQSKNPYSPALPPAPQVEYPLGPDVTEANDPTREEEEAFEAEQKIQAEQEGEEAEHEEEE
eukprot:m.88611 g.88611  ORF g.88611 m.88611 type:complete len:495 (-) comp15196_c0_seq1:192-1676(-)